MPREWMEQKRSRLVVAHTSFCASLRAVPARKSQRTFIAAQSSYFAAQNELNKMSR
jgi:hypothetical protein